MYPDLTRPSCGKQLHGRIWEHFKRVPGKKVTRKMI